MSTAITKLEARVFRVDFGKLAKEQEGILARLLPSRGPVEVDPFLVGHAVLAVMHCCRSKDVHGRRLAWNEYKVFLSNRDRQDLKVLEEGLKSGLDTLIQQTLVEMQAEMVGDPMVRILIDEANSVAQGVAEVSVDFTTNFHMKPAVPGQATVRLQHGIHLPSMSPPQQGASSVTPSVAPGPSPVPPGPSQKPLPGAVRLCWGGHEVAITAGQKVLVGRPHDMPPANFVALEGATTRISKLHLAVENGATGVMISRPSNANPLQVDDRPVQRGGKRLVEQLPVELKLSNGEMVLQLLPRAGG